MTTPKPGGLDELARTLRELRHAAGPGRKMTLAEAADAAGFSIPKISRIESGKNTPTPHDVHILTQIYRADTPTTERLISIAELLQQKTRRIVLSTRPNRAAFQNKLRQFDELFGRVVEFGAVWMPGLVQTPEYIRAVFASASSDPEAVNEAVAERLARGRILYRADKEVLVLLTEGALGWALGPPELMLGQLSHLEEVIRKTATTATRIGIVPFGTPASFMPVSGWTLWDDQVVVPSILATQAVLRPPNVDPYVRQLAQLEQVAVFGDEARQVLERVARRYRQMS